MSLIKCKECREKISSRAKTCPQCGCPVPAKTSLFTWLILVLIGFGAYTITQTPTPTKPNPTATVTETATATPTTIPSNVSLEPRNQAAKDSVVAIFKSDEEPTARDAIWTSDSMFKVGVIDNGSNRNGYASYVCEVLREHGLSSGHFVEVVDIVSISRGGAWTVLGDARC